jgi:hypothetical protein
MKIPTPIPKISAIDSSHPVSKNALLLSKEAMLRVKIVRITPVKKIDLKELAQKVPVKIDGIDLKTAFNKCIKFL